MSVYVDQLFACSPTRHWHYRRACHLLADTDVELEAFARRLYLKPGWKHGDHYDLTPNKRRAAIAAGAIEVNAGALVRIRRMLMAADAAEREGS